MNTQAMVYRGVAVRSPGCSIVDIRLSSEEKYRLSTLRFVLSVARKRPSERLSDNDLEPITAPEIPKAEVSHEEIERSRSPSLPDLGSTGGIVLSSPLDATSKERTSYLFNSSPSTRELLPEDSAESPYTGRIQASQQRHMSPSASPQVQRNIRKRVEESHSHATKPRDLPTAPVQSIFGPTESQEVEAEGKASHSIFGGPIEREPAYSTPSRNVKSPSAHLDTIKESSPDESPLNKKSRAITDVGAPERGVKSARRSGTPKSFHERLQSPPPRSAGATPSTKDGQPGVTQIPFTTDDALSRLSWPPVDEEHETVGIDRALSLTPSRRLPHDQHTPNINVDPTKRRGSEQLSPSSLSEHDRSGVSVARYKTPDHLRPLSAASNRSATPPLRRIDRSLSGDLRSASRLGEGKARDAKISPQQSAVPGPSTYDPFKDKGKARALDMADVYVSTITISR